MKQNKKLSQNEPLTHWDVVKTVIITILIIVCIAGIFYATYNLGYSNGYFANIYPGCG